MMCHCWRRRDEIKNSFARFVSAFHFHSANCHFISCTSGAHKAASHGLDCVRHFVLARERSAKFKSSRRRCGHAQFGPRPAALSPNPTQTKEQRPLVASQQEINSLCNVCVTKIIWTAISLLNIAPTLTN